jgi:hypothetical protein
MGKSAKEKNSKVTQSTPLMRVYRPYPNQRGSLINRRHKKRKAATMASATRRNARAWIQPCTV